MRNSEVLMSRSALEFPMVPLSLSLELTPPASEIPLEWSPSFISILNTGRGGNFSKLLSARGHVRPIINNGARERARVTLAAKKRTRIYIGSSSERERETILHVQEKRKKPPVPRVWCSRGGGGGGAVENPKEQSSPRGSVNRGNL